MWRFIFLLVPLPLFAGLCPAQLALLDTYPASRHTFFKPPLEGNDRDLNGSVKVVLRHRAALLRPEADSTHIIEEASNLAEALFVLFVMRDQTERGRGLEFSVFASEQNIVFQLTDQSGRPLTLYPELETLLKQPGMGFSLTYEGAGNKLSVAFAWDQPLQTETLRRSTSPEAVAYPLVDHAVEQTPVP